MPIALQENCGAIYSTIVKPQISLESNPLNAILIITSWCSNLYSLRCPSLLRCGIFRLKSLSNGSEDAIASKCICMAIIVSQWRREHVRVVLLQVHSVLTSRSLVRFLNSQVEQLENAQARSLFADDALLLVETGLYADFCAPLRFLSSVHCARWDSGALFNLRACSIHTLWFACHLNLIGSAPWAVSRIPE